MAQIDDRTSLLNKDLVLGGVVTAVRESRMKNGKPCGFTRIEDFTGSGEIALFGEPWLKWCNMMKVGNFLYINAKCVQNRYMPEPRDSAGSGATEEGLTSRGGRNLRLPLRFGLRPQGPFRVGTGESGLVLSEEGIPAGL